MRSHTVPHHTTIRKAAFLLVFSLIIAMFCLGAPAPAQAVTINKCLDIDSDETWISDNVYRVYCDVFVPSGVTLTIQAGTVVTRSLIASISMGKVSIVFSIHSEMGSLSPSISN